MKHLILASTVFIAMGSVASADLLETITKSSKRSSASLERVPVAQATQQWFIDPATRCQYSRAQAPGYAPSWHLIMNPRDPAAVRAHAACPVRLALQN